MKCHTQNMHGFLKLFYKYEKSIECTDLKLTVCEDAG